MEQEFYVWVDHHQFYVHDADPEVNLEFTFDNFDMKVESNGHAIMVNTERAVGYVPIIIEIAPQRPDTSTEKLAIWQQVVETSFEIYSGKLNASAPWFDIVDRPLKLPKGLYGALIYFGDIDTADDDSDIGADHYRIVLWPTKTELKTRIIKEHFDYDWKRPLPPPYVNGWDLAKIQEFYLAGNINERCHAVVRLAQIAQFTTTTPVEMLRQILATEKSPAVRRVAASALRMGEQFSVNLIIELLRDKDAQVRFRAAQSIGNPKTITNTLTPAYIQKSASFIQPLLKLLRDKKELVQREAATALAQVAARLNDSTVVDLVVPTLTSTNSKTRLAGLFALDKLSSELEQGYTIMENIVPTLIPLLQDPAPEVQERTVDLIGKIKPQQDGSSITDLLVNALNDSAWEVRESAARALGKMKDKIALVPLKQALLDDEHFRVREVAAVALGNLADEQAVEALIAATKDSTANVRYCAVFALADIGGSRVVDFLLQSLAITSDEYDTVPDAAANALIRLKDPNSIEPLNQLLTHPLDRVRERATRILNEIGAD